MSEKRKPRVLLTVCSMGWIHRSIMPQIIWAAKDTRVAQCDYNFPVDGLYETKMNCMAKEVIDQEYDFWLNIDDDNGPTKNCLDLLELDLPVVGFPTPIWKDDGDPEKAPFMYNACDEVPAHTGEPTKYIQHFPLEGLQVVDAVGSGCMLVARRVLLALKFPMFVRMHNEDGTDITKGPDYYFCEQVRKAGFEVHAHFRYNCNHIKEVELGTMIQRMVTFTNEKGLAKVGTNSPSDDKE